MLLNNFKISLLIEIVVLSVVCNHIVQSNLIRIRPSSLSINSDLKEVARSPRALYFGARKPLVIKPFQAIPNVQSDLYEVYMEPYSFDLRAVQAVVMLQGEGESPVRGELIFVQRHPPAGPVIIRGNITGLPAGKHGLHIHQAGDMRQGCEKLGEHYNPYLLHHGGPRDPERHVGDLGNVEAKDDGMAEVNQIDPVMSLNGFRGVIGRALVVTENEDDFGRGGTADSVNTGSAGKPIACGIISYIR